MQEAGSEVPALVNWNRYDATVWMSENDVAAALSYLNEAMLTQHAKKLARTENR